MKNTHIILTRTHEQNESLARKLSDVGASVSICPALHIKSIASLFIDSYVEKLYRSFFDILIVTSQNTILALQKNGVHTIPTSCLLIAVGSKTAALARSIWGASPLIPQTQFSSEGILELLPHVSGKRIFLPHGNLADDKLAEELTKRGAFVESLVLYQTVPVTNWQMPPLHFGLINFITFFSPSAVEATLSEVAQESQLKIACIGTTTAQYAQDNGLTVACIGTPQNEDGLLQSLLMYTAQYT